MNAATVMIGTPAAMGILVVILAVILVAAFAAGWLKDRGRAKDVADDPARFTDDSEPRNPANGR